MKTNEPWRATIMAAAWFYDGEGSTVLSYGLVHISVVQNGDDYVLRRFRDALGVGKIYGPYPPRTPRCKPRYDYRTTTFEHAQAAIAMMWQFLSPIKRRQAALALMGDRSFRAIKRGSHKQPVCAKGHPMVADTDIRWARIPEGKRRRCLLCSRDYHRIYMRRRRATLRLVPAPKAV